MGAPPAQPAWSPDLLPRNSPRQPQVSLAAVGVGRSRGRAGFGTAQEAHLARGLSGHQTGHRALLCFRAGRSLPLTHIPSAALTTTTPTAHLDSQCAPPGRSGEGRQDAAAKTGSCNRSEKP